MKKNKILTFVLCLGMMASFSACESLDQAPQDYFGSGNFWKDQPQASGYMVGLHAYLRGTYSSWFVMGELRNGLLGDGDDGMGTSVMGESLDNQNIIKQDLTADKAGMDNWNGLYSEIVRVNLAIQEISKTSVLTEAQKNLYLGQAYGIRAYYYYLLYTTWGGVPLVTDVAITEGQVSAERLKRPRAKASEIMNLLKQDITESEKAYGAYGADGFSNKYTWSKYATLMLKANIYAWAATVTTDDQKATGNADLQTAKAALQEVINSNKFALTPSFVQTFRTDAKSTTKEMILAVPYNKTDNAYMPYISHCVAQEALLTAAYDKDGKHVALDNDSYGNRTLTGGLVRYQYKETLWKAYDADDTRRDATFFVVCNNPAAPKTGSNFGILLKKFSGTYYPDEGTHRFDCDGPIFRYAEALLLMAEIENDLGGDPTLYLNKVRERAYGNTAHNFANQGKYQNTLNILGELDKEFVFEGKRWFALQRMTDQAGKALVFNADVNYLFIPGGAKKPILSEAEAYKTLWPISIRTHTNDASIQQNPGYEEFK